MPNYFITLMSSRRQRIHTTFLLDYCYRGYKATISFLSLGSVLEGLVTEHTFV